MVLVHTTTFRSFHQGVEVTLSMHQNGANSFVVRCRPCGYPLLPKYDTVCGSLAEAESIFTRKFNIGMTGVA